MKKQSCKNCKYHGSVPLGSTNPAAPCTRFPPQVFTIPVQTLQGMQVAPAAMQPQTNPDQWCGEWATGNTVLAMNA